MSFHTLSCDSRFNTRCLFTPHVRGFAIALALASTSTSVLAAGDSNKLDEVVVTASPIPHDPDYLAAIASSVNRDQILQQGGANLADALANEPGITGTGFASGASRPVIRGFDANRVRVLEDGIGSFDVSDVGPDHGVPIDPLSATKIEVVRGAATLRYGSQAIGGVVNAINNRVPTALPDKPFAGEVTGAYGDNADTRQGSALLDAKVGQLALHADGFARHTDNYDTPEGTQPNSYFKGDGYSAGGSYFFGDSHIGVGGVHYDSQYGIPSDTTYIDMKQTKGMAKSLFAINAGAFQTLAIDGGYADYEHTERDPITGEALSTFKDKEWDSRAEGLFGQIGPLSGLALGVQLQKKNFSALGDGGDYLDPTTTQTSAAFTFAELKPSDRIDIDAGARVEHVKIDGTPASDQFTSLDFTPVSASAGLLFDVNKTVRIGLTLSSAARAPAQTELFARGPHDGPGTFETGDPGLKVERANSIEGSLRLRFDAARVDTSVWGTRFSNYIYGQLTGRTCDSDGNCVSNDSLDLKELNYTQVGAKFWGAETKATIPLLQQGDGKLEGTVLADYVRAKTVDGDNLPRISPYHLGAGVQWNGDVIGAGLLAKYTGARTDVAVAETPTSGFMSVDANLAWHVLPGTPGLELSLVAHNLTNSTQRNAVALNKDDVIMPGRDVRLMVRATF
jgi:iron complex outermembrane receptor protein